MFAGLPNSIGPSRAGKYDHKPGASNGYRIGYPVSN